MNTLLPNFSNLSSHFGSPDCALWIGIALIGCTLFYLSIVVFGSDPVLLSCLPFEKEPKVRHRRGGWFFKRRRVCVVRLGVESQSMLMKEQSCDAS